jgi:hypothetical protein
MYLEVGVVDCLGDGRAIGRGGFGSEGDAGGVEGVLVEEEESNRRDEGRAWGSRGWTSRCAGAVVALLQALQAVLADSSMRKLEEEREGATLASATRSSRSNSLNEARSAQ